MNIDKSSVMKCNDNVHGMYSVEESVRSLTWHPHYEEVLFMGLFNSTLVFVDVQVKINHIWGNLARHLEALLFHFSSLFSFVVAIISY